MLDGLASLVDKSLVRQFEDARSEPRFTMLETIREYALERLQESEEEDTLRRQHAGFFLSLAEATEPNLHGPGDRVWLERLMQEHDNFRAALTWSRGAANAGEIELRLVGAVWLLWFTHSHADEGRRWLEGALARPDQQAPTRARARALLGAGHIALYCHLDYATAQTWLEACVAVCKQVGEQLVLARALGDLGWRARLLGDYATARRLGEESVAVGREVGQKPHLFMLLHFLGLATLQLDDYPAAQSAFKESLAIARELGDRWGMTRPLAGLAQLARIRGDYPAARSLFERSIALRREQGDFWMPGALNDLAEVACLQGDFETARTLYQECLAINRERSDRQSLCWLLGAVDGLAGVAEAKGQYERAARLLGAAAALREARCIPLNMTYRTGPEELEQRVARVCVALGDEAFTTAWAAGQAMSLAEAVEYAISVTAHCQDLPL